MLRQQYQVSVYTDRATKRVSVETYRSKSVTFSQFQAIAAEYVSIPTATVLLTRLHQIMDGGVTLASKSTDHTWVQIERAFYEREG